MYTKHTSSVGGRHRRRRRAERLSGKTRFRAIVRMVMYHRAWLTERSSVVVSVDDDIKKNVLKIDVMTREKYQSLTLQNKSLLRKDQCLRTPDEIENLHKVIGNLKCFRRYPENVRKELVASTYFEYYGPNRMVVRQNHVATFLGFVLSGDLEVSVTKVDPVFGNLVTEATSQLQPGSVFGEVSLLHNIPRTATVTSTKSIQDGARSLLGIDQITSEGGVHINSSALSHCLIPTVQYSLYYLSSSLVSVFTSIMFKKAAVELLILKKDDFDRVLKASMQKQWDEISSAMKQFPYFDNWDDVATRECCMLSDTYNGDPHEIVLGKNVGKQGSAHFVLSGTCSMVQKLMIGREGDKFKLYPPDKRGPGVEPLLMQVCLFTQGACFNLGESHAERTIVADTDTRVLRIPLYLLRQHNVANIWSRIRQFLESRMSSDQELFQKFLEAKRWDKYKKETCTYLRNPNTLNDTTIHDAPYYWRVMDMELCDDKPCDPYMK